MTQVSAETTTTHPSKSGRVWEMTIHGKPRTKKTSNEIHLTVPKSRMVAWLADLLRRYSTNPGKLMGMVLRRVKVQPSKLWRQWAKQAPVTHHQQWMNPNEFPIESQVWVVATFYRDRRVGDYFGYLQGLGDFLQQRGIIKDDKQIVHCDGSRLDKDKDNPRIELTIHELVPVEKQLELDTK